VNCMHNVACNQDAFDQKSGMFRRITGFVNSLLDIYEMIPAQQEYEKLKELSPGLALKIKNRLT